jgi:hypothetical protein
MRSAVVSRRRRERNNTAVAAKRLCADQPVDDFLDYLIVDVATSHSAAEPDAG